MEEEGESGAGPGPGGSAPVSRSPSTADLHEYRARVAAAVRRNCPTWMRAQVDDIAQNVLLKLLKVIDRSEGNRSFSAVYLEKSAHGTVVDEIRRVCRRREEPLGREEMVERIPAESGDPERHSSAREIARGIFDCLDRLSRPRRLAVALFLNGCTVPEAANHLRWHLKRTESLVYRGLAELRRCLERKGLKP